MTEVDRVITEEESDEIISGVECTGANVDINDDSVVIDFDGCDIKIQFESLGDKLYISQSTNGMFATVTRYLIHTEDETLDVDFDGVINLDITGVSYDED